MDWFNLYGAIFIVIVLIPNLFAAFYEANGASDLWKNKAVEAIEWIGRVGSMIFMAFNVPGTYCGFWFDGGLIVYLVGGGILLLLLLYCSGWVLFWKKHGMARAIALSVIPTILFLFCGIMLLSALLIGAAVLFGIGHIAISVKNEKTRVKNEGNPSAEQA